MKVARVVRSARTMDRVGWSGSAVAIALVTLAAGASEPEPVVIAYDPPEGCPDREALLREIGARTAHLRPAAPGQLARRYRVVITARGKDGWEGRLELVDEEGRGVERTVAAATCDEAMSALALVAALAIEARLGERAEAPSASAARPPGPAAPLAPPGAGAPPPEATGARAARPTASAQPPAGALAPGARLGVVGIGATGAAPDPAFGPGLAVELRGDEGAALGRLIPFALFGPRHEVSGGAARFSLYAARGEACLGGATLGSRLRARPCAFVEGGALEARGLRTSALTRPASTTLPWIALGPSARLDLRLEDRVSLDLALGLLVPVRREAFVLRNVGGQREVTVHEIPLAGGWLTAGLSVALGR